MTPVPNVLNPNFRARNLVAYNFAAFACISLVVFLSASQPFYLSDVIKINPDQVGRITGRLGVVEELTVMLTSPFLGTLNDRLQGIAWKRTNSPSGPRILQLGGFAALAVALFGYARIAHHVVPDLYMFRAIFAVGVSSVMGIAVVMLHEASNSDFSWRQLKFWTRRQSPDEAALASAAQSPELRAESDAEDQLFVEEGEWAAEQIQTRHQGKLSALLGMCTGFGAIFAVSVFLPIPAGLSLSHPEWSSADCLRATYSFLAVLAVVSGVFVYFGGYDSVKQRRQVYTEFAAGEPDASYLTLMREAVIVSLNSRKIQLAYMAGFVARATSIATSVFIPLIVYKFYAATGACGGPDMRADAPQRDECFNAFIFSAILSGVASTASLFSTPVWSYVVDAPRYGSRSAIFAASVTSSSACFLLCLLGSGSGVYDPRNATCFILLGLIGIAQMGVIIASMSLVSSAGQSLEDAEHRVIGSITGLYNLSGGVGILIVSFIGGSWSDHWVFGPFFILGALNVVLVAASGWAVKHEW